MTEKEREDYRKMLRTCRNIGVSIIPTWKAAKIMAILQIWGNNEGFAMSDKFDIEREYIQETYHLHGGDVPDTIFQRLFKEYVEYFEGANAEKSERFEEAKELISDRYGFDLIFG